MRQGHRPHLTPSSQDAMEREGISRKPIPTGVDMLHAAVERVNACEDMEALTGEPGAYEPVGRWHDPEGAGIQGGLAYFLDLQEAVGTAALLAMRLESIRSGALSTPVPEEAFIASGAVHAYTHPESGEAVAVVAREYLRASLSDDPKLTPERIEAACENCLGEGLSPWLLAMYTRLACSSEET